MRAVRLLTHSFCWAGGVESSITTATTNAIQKTSTHVTSQLTEHLFEDPMGNQTTVPCGLDLVSLNIQRGRDHGLPGYTKWREYCGLPKPLKFDDLKGDMDPEALDSISKLYDNVDDVDLYTGALAEVTKGDGLVGPTFTCLIADQFERLQLGDKYWYETPDEPGSFNEGTILRFYARKFIFFFYSMSIKFKLDNLHIYVFNTFPIIISIVFFNTHESVFNFGYYFLCYKAI